MSARVSVSAHATSPAAVADARAGTGAAARTASLLDGAGPVSAADGNDSSGDDAATGTGARAGQPFADALANATRASGPKSGRDTGSAQSAVIRPGSAAGAAASAATTQTAGPAPSAAALISAAGTANSATATATAAAAAAAAAATAAQSAGAGPAEADGSAGVDDANATDGTTPSSPGRSGHHGRGAASSAIADDSGSGEGALALLQSAAASLAIPWQPAGAGDLGTSDDEETGDDATAGSAGNVPAAAAGGGANLPPTSLSTTAAAAASNANASADPAAAQALANAQPGTSAVLAGTGVAGSTPTPAHSATGAADAAEQGSAAVRAASWMPQFLSAVPAAAGSDGVARAIAVPMSDPSWPQALAAQVHWMAGSQVQSATLSLSPQHLGPIQVRIDLQQSQINVNFTAAHADTRAALADAMPRLREMLAAGGLSLGQANVQQHSAGNGPAAPPASPGMRESAETVDSVAVSAARALGLVDEYV